MWFIGQINAFYIIKIILILIFVGCSIDTISGNGITPTIPEVIKKTQRKQVVSTSPIEGQDDFNGVFSHTQLPNSSREKYHEPNDQSFSSKRVSKVVSPVTEAHGDQGQDSSFMGVSNMFTPAMENHNHQTQIPFIMQEIPTLTPTTEDHNHGNQDSSKRVSTVLTSGTEHFSNQYKNSSSAPATELLKHNKAKVHNDPSSNFPTRRIPMTDHKHKNENLDAHGHSPDTHRLSFLDKVLRGYDKRAWPTYGMGKPINISVNMYVNSLGSVSAADMDYTMDIYLRQIWYDHRLNLKYYDINETVTLNGANLIGRLWKPDLYFYNVKDASFHTVTVPNAMVMVSGEGRILYSLRLKLRLSCQMSFKHYPMDIQHCPIILGSCTYSCLRATIVFKRQNGFHLLQTYLPTFLVVLISWVSFWLSVDAVPARTTLGVTTLLTITTLAAGVRTQLPPVSYIKAIDVWIGVCSVMVFGALLEFTLVNYLSRSKLRPDEFRKSINLLNWQLRREEERKEQRDEIQKEKSRNLKRSKMVDRVSRATFPFVFFVFNIAYWPYYLLVDDDYQTTQSAV
ncbi:glycine receptor subunit alpha-2-like isoform X2 [Tachypleus tridentatus]|uniref:glycine receptor subunit alpha-2-like isoform X2 n=1 Tax=Tachypleus tridentatus TaxID=6853 RepID=UPI003FD2C2EF